MNFRYILSNLQTIFINNEGRMFKQSITNLQQLLETHLDEVFGDTKSSAVLWSLAWAYLVLASVPRSSPVALVMAPEVGPLSQLSLGLYITPHPSLWWPGSRSLVAPFPSPAHYGFYFCGFQKIFKVASLCKQNYLIP